VFLYLLTESILKKMCRVLLLVFGSENVKVVAISICVVECVACSLGASKSSQFACFVVETVDNFVQTLDRLKCGGIHILHAKLNC
jgi:hypothetical protein